MTDKFPSDQAKAEALDNARPFDVHKWSDFPEVNNAITQLNIEVTPLTNGNDSERIKTKHIKIVVLDLYVNWLGDPERYVSFHRSKTAYKRDSRYNKINASFAIVTVIDALHKLGYIEAYKGFHDMVGDRSKLSRMKATDKLIDLIQNKHKVTRQAISKYKGTETIILRDWVTHKVNGKDVERKEDIEYNDNRSTKKMREELQAYNDLLQRTDIRIPDTDAEYIKTIISKKAKKPRNNSKPRKIVLNDPDYFVRRVFNNGSWEQGGRYHGGWWQRINGDLRVCITFNGSEERPCEVDYSGLHIVILYAMEGIDYWDQYGRDSDPYKLDGYEQTERMRGLLKLVLLASVNAQDRTTAVQAVQKEINFSHNDDDEGLSWVNDEPDVDLSELIEAFALRHKPIKEYLCTGIGLKLQHLDSLIAEKVVNHFTSKGIPTLCIHDSLLIDNKHSTELVNIMNTAFKEIISEYRHRDIDEDDNLV